MDIMTEEEEISLSLPELPQIGNYYLFNMAAVFILGLVIGVVFLQSYFHLIQNYKQLVFLCLTAVLALGVTAFTTLTLAKHYKKSLNDSRTKTRN